jgi:hypothetical protein
VIPIGEKPREPGESFSMPFGTGEQYCTPYESILMFQWESSPGLGSESLPGIEVETPDSREDSGCRQVSDLPFMKRFKGEGA